MVPSLVCAIVVGWLAFLPLGLLYGRQFLQHLQLSIEPPPGTPSYKAEQSLNKAFPLQAMQVKNGYVLLVARAGGLPVVNTSAPHCLWHGIHVNSRCPLVEPLAQFSGDLERWLFARFPGWFDARSYASACTPHRQDDPS